MKKFLLLILVATGFSAGAQVTTATDFTANDCAGNPHHLFADLDSGKVVVISFVMPCTSCIGPTLTAYNIVQSYATSNPGQVLFFVSDDQQNTTCSTLSGWCTNNIAANITCFSDASVAESDYGNISMPKIVVLSGTNHHVYFLADNSAAGNSTAIQQAINNALAANGISEIGNSYFSMSATTVSNELTVTMMKFENRSYTILNSAGVKIAESTIDHSSFSVDVSQLANGIYFLNVRHGNETQAAKFVVLH